MKIPIFTGLTSGVLLLLELENFFSIGKLINKFAPCEQNPMNSFPCFGRYDIYFMFLLIVIFVLSLIIIGIQAYGKRT